MEQAPLVERVGAAAKENLGRRASLALFLAGIVAAGVRLRRGYQGKFPPQNVWQSLDPQLFGYPSSLEGKFDDETKKYIVATKPKQFLEVQLGEDGRLTSLLVLSYLDEVLDERKLSALAGESAAAYSRAPESVGNVAILSIGGPTFEPGPPGELRVKVDNEADNQVFQLELQRTMHELHDAPNPSEPQPAVVQIVHHK